MPPGSMLLVAWCPSVKVCSLYGGVCLSHIAFLARRLAPRLLPACDYVQKHWLLRGGTATPGNGKQNKKDQRLLTALSKVLRNYGHDDDEDDYEDDHMQDADYWQPEQGQIAWWDAPPSRSWAQVASAPPPSEDSSLLHALQKLVSLVSSHSNGSAQRSLLHDLRDLVWRHEQYTSWYEAPRQQVPPVRRVEGPKGGATQARKKPPDKPSAQPVPKSKLTRFKTIASNAICSYHTLTKALMEGSLPKDVKFAVVKTDNLPELQAMADAHALPLPMLPWH